MYEYLDGRLESRHATRVVVDVGGVGYCLAIPLGSDFRRAPRGPEGAVRVWTHLVVRDDAHLLYGFADDESRQLFRLLLTVRGIGPGLALGILSHLSGDALLAAIATGDAQALLAVRGVGKKTAQQILLDLKDRAPSQPATVRQGVVVPAGRDGRVLEDAIHALVSIGYSDKEARKNVEQAASRVDEDDLETLVRTALRQ